METGVAVVLLVLQAGICCGFCAWLGKAKGRDPLWWGILGFLFGLFALITVAGAPPVSVDKAADDEMAERARALGLRDI